MKKVNVLIVEDEILVAKDIGMQLESIGYDICQVVTRADEALRAAENHQPDIVIMDIHIEGPIDGIKAAAKIGQLYNIPFIFLTDLRDDATFQRAIKTGPAVFLNKPVSEFNLSRHIEHAIFEASRQNQQNNEYIFNDCIWIKDDGAFHKIMKKDILWLKASGAYCEIHTSSNNKLTISKSMREVIDRLGDPTFIRVHKSYTVNSEAIDGMKGLKIYIQDNQIDVGKTYLQGLKEKINPI